MLCPFCGPDGYVIKKGRYIRKSDDSKIQKYSCKVCFKGFSDQTISVEYRLRLRNITQWVFHLLCSGNSQRRCAYLCKTRPRSIARRVVIFGERCKGHLANYRESRSKASQVLFDEMESFEHTKCKPLTMPIAVEDKTRKILALRVGNIAAKGGNAQRSVEKYGKRECQRRRVIDEMLAELKTCTSDQVIIKTDMCQHYPGSIKKFFTEATHRTYKGRRARYTGQGELKVGGYDPLFSINHTFATIRCNIKRLSRQTWATTKRRDRLENLLYVHAWFHNMWVDRDKVEVHLA